MDADFKSRKQVSYDQMKGLLEFLQDHQDLAKGLTRGMRGKLHSLSLWNLCVKKLNPIEDGAKKDGRGWSKYWCDWKYRVRRKALELKAAKDNNRPPPDDILPLSHMEECILGLIGESAVDGVVIKSDPLGDGDTDDDEADTNDNNDDVPLSAHGTRSKSSRGRKRRHSSREPSDLEDGGGPSGPPDRKPRVTARNEEAADSVSEHDNEVAEFLRLERENLEHTRVIKEALQTIAAEMTRLADELSLIREMFLNNRVNL